MLKIGLMLLELSMPVKLFLKSFHQKIFKNHEKTIFDNNFYF